MSLFDHIAPVPLDPVLVSIEQFAADPRPGKVNLGVGMYYDDTGKVPLLGAVRHAEDALQLRTASWTYMMSEGVAGLRAGALALAFGADHKLIAEGRIACIQTLGGTGALRIGGELIAQLSPGTTVALGRPSWANHPTLFAAAGLKLVHVPYYDPITMGVDFAGMCQALRTLPPGSVTVLHAACHNPTGADLTEDDWRVLAELHREHGLIPFIDFAYQGFADGIEQDAFAVRLFAETGLPLFVALSFSKNFALYGERVGALMVVTRNAAEAANLVGQSKSVIRNLYSTPPTHGAALVGEILGSTELQALWREEVEAMRRRILAMRHSLHDRLAHHNVGDFANILTQRGLFSYTGLTPAQVQRLREEHAVHAVADGRICVAALNPGNLDRVANALREVATP
jgi:aromatic-amino-acid transaminase